MKTFFTLTFFLTLTGLYAVTPLNNNVDIHTPQGWSDGLLPTKDKPGIVNKDCWILGTNSPKPRGHQGKKTSNGFEIFYTIKPGVTVKRKTAGTRLDFEGDSKINISGTLDLIGDLLNDKVTTFRIEQNAIVTVKNGGLLRINTEKDSASEPTELLLRDNAKLNIQGGTVEAPQLTCKDGDPRIIIRNGGKLNIMKLSEPFKGRINFPAGSNGELQISSLTNPQNAKQFFLKLWKNDILSYNGKTRSQIDGSKLFNKFFKFDNTTLVLTTINANDRKPNAKQKNKTTLKPIPNQENIKISITNQLLSITTNDESNIEKYIVIDYSTDEVLETFIAGQRKYTTRLPNATPVRVIVIDKNNNRTTLKASKS